MDFFKLLRYSHIFSSAVREVLETNLLHEVSPFPLSLSQFHILKLMSVDGEHQVGDVADLLGVSAPAATKNIDKLERLGLIVRKPSKGDRRAILLSVSPLGRKLVLNYEELKSAKLYPLLAEFPEEDVAQFTELLERFSVALFKLEEAGEGYCLRCSAYLEDGCPIGRVRGGCPYQEICEERAGSGIVRKNN
jgi:DNA-binding MarR family transcriptional regulator